ncbi:MAG TPA: hypothetical protein ENN13_00275 [Candidatus Altiarchaeales archaeon]|nr:hypothetical protein [Candidatus Altiarchaeales archaeon]
MDEKEFNHLYNKLDSFEAVRALEAEGYDHELLFVIYTNRIIRDTKKRHYSVKRKSKELLSRWRRGESFLELAREHKFSPVITASILLQQMGWSKKRVRRSLQEPRMIEDSRIREDLRQASDADLIYSPYGNQRQFDRGKEVELFVGRWLKERGRGYMTEKDAQAEGHPKTPDFKLEAPIKVDGKWVNWIECKGTFGDRVEINKNYTTQLTHYVDLFGAGMVVYWFGFIEDILRDERIIVKDKDFFTSENI